jgi:hypothetical protein
VRRGIPALVLIRPPRDAVVSWVIHSPQRTVPSALRGYLRFYEPLVPLRNRIVVATFGEAVSDLGAVIERVNDRFGTSFAPFVPSAENLARIRGEIEADYVTRADDPARREQKISRPSEAREAMKDAVTKRFDAASPRLRSRANAVYGRLSPG